MYPWEYMYSRLGTPVLKERQCQRSLDYRQNRRQNVFNRGLYFCARGFDIENLIKQALIYCGSYFSLGGLVLCLGGAMPTKPPGQRE